MRVEAAGGPAGPASPILYTVSRNFLRAVQVRLLPSSCETARARLIDQLWRLAIWLTHKSLAAADRPAWSHMTHIHGCNHEPAETCEQPSCSPQNPETVHGKGPTVVSGNSVMARTIFLDDDVDDRAPYGRGFVSLRAVGSPYGCSFALRHSSVF